MALTCTQLRAQTRRCFSLDIEVGSCHALVYSRVLSVLSWDVAYASPRTPLAPPVRRRTALLEPEACVCSCAAGSVQPKATIAPRIGGEPSEPMGPRSLRSPIQSPPPQPAPVAARLTHPRATSLASRRLCGVLPQPHLSPTGSARVYSLRNALRDVWRLLAGCLRPATLAAHSLKKLADVRNEPMTG